MTRDRPLAFCFHRSFSGHISEFFRFVAANVFSLKGWGGGGQLLLVKGVEEESN